MDLSPTVRRAARAILNRFAKALDGVDLDDPGAPRAHWPREACPRVAWPIRRVRPVEVRDVEFLRAINRPPDQDHDPGPFHEDAADPGRHYADDRSLALASRRPSTRSYKTSRPPARTSSRWTNPTSRPAARPHRVRLEVIERAPQGHRRHTVLHMCFGYAAIVNEKPAATRSSRVERQPASTRSRSRPPSPNSTMRC